MTIADKLREARNQSLALGASVDRLFAINAQLLEACKEALDYMRFEGGIVAGSVTRNLRAAIAAAEKGE